ncbi:MAG: alpha/beta fold hydrolase [Friedmanniella sp.]
MSTATAGPAGSDLTVALVHGAFADSSSWYGVIRELRHAGLAVRAVPNPLRGITHDAAYVASALSQLPGRVLAVGHSYGGAVLTNAALTAGNVVGLVFVAAFAPDEGETLLQIEAGSTDSVLNSALEQRTYPDGNGGTVAELFIAPDKFHDAFAADLSAEEAELGALTQRPASVQAFGEPTGKPAWASLPSWAVVATGDKAAGSDVVRRMAERAQATITEVEASHVVMQSQPRAVADVILAAAEALKSDDPTRSAMAGRAT